VATDLHYFSRDSFLYRLAAHIIAYRANQQI